ncbi:MAG: pyridoxamine 5'-phosphate oxidase family protein [Bifidobacteriaceae bacterium]|nr:pyridoxamine 5'-phosphate oxidase family protein [Bifidobacteriaceae bacterium]
MTNLSREESYRLLQGEQLGRLVVRRKDDMDLFQINYVVDGDDIYFRTAEGTKLFSINVNHDVLFAVDKISEGEAWSVIIKGDAHWVTDLDQIQHCDTLPLKPWLPTLKYNYVRITPRLVSGRHYEFGEEPERY